MQKNEERGVYELSRLPSISVEIFAGLRRQVQDKDPLQHKHRTDRAGSG